MERKGEFKGNRAEGKDGINKIYKIQKETLTGEP
jgi:hypothetical protein